MSKDCSSRMKCLKCGRQHHTSICMSNTNDEVKCLHSATVERSASLPQSQTSSSLPRESNWRPRDKTYAKSVLGTGEGTSGPEKKVLGVRWNFISDQFVLDLREIATLARNIEPTKRNAATVTAKFYDPMGFLSPITTEFF